MSKIKPGMIVAYRTKDEVGYRGIVAEVDRLSPNHKKAHLRTVPDDVPLLIPVDVLTPIKTVWQDTMKEVKDVKERRPKAKTRRTIKKWFNRLDRNGSAIFIKIKDVETELLQELLNETHKRNCRLLKFGGSIEEMSNKAIGVFTAGEYLLVKDCKDGKAIS